MKNKKNNPKSIPRTQADVDKARDKGLLEGLKAADILMLNVLVDKHENEIDVVQVWNEFKKMQAELAEGRIKIREVEKMLKEEYHIDLDN